MWYSCAVFLTLLAISYADFQCPICTGSDCENDVQISSCSNVRNVLFIDADQDVNDYKCVYLEYKDGAGSKVARKCLASTSYENCCDRLISSGSVTRCEITEPNKPFVSAFEELEGELSSTTTTEITSVETTTEGATTTTTTAEPTTTTAAPTTTTAAPTTTTAAPTTTTAAPTTTTVESTTVTMESTTTSIETTTQGGNISNPMSALIILIISVICKFVY